MAQVSRRRGYTWKSTTEVLEVEETAELSGRGEGGSDNFSYWLIENSDDASAEASGTKPFSSAEIGDVGFLGDWYGGGGVEKTGKDAWELFSEDGRASWRNLRTVSVNWNTKRNERNTD